MLIISFALNELAHLVVNCGDGSILKDSLNDDYMMRFSHIVHQDHDTSGKEIMLNVVLSILVLLGVLAFVYSLSNLY